jgi:ADP-ribose pyrophosphatase YjhB (NUDIX family)
MTYTYEHPGAALAVDCVVFGLDETDLKVLLIQRKLTPFQHAWALPGGFVRLDEAIDQVAQRGLKEEAGVDDVYLEQLYMFGTLGHDPRAGRHRSVLRARQAVRPPDPRGDRRDGRPSSTSATFARRSCRWTCWSRPTRSSRASAHRAARLYRFDRRKYERLLKQCFELSI